MHSKNISFNHSIAKKTIERSIKQIVDSFMRDPFIYFNEADAVTGLCNTLLSNSIFNNKYYSRISPAFSIGLIHREYPTNLFTGRNRSLGHFDLAILTPKFIEQNHISHIARPSRKRSSATAPQKLFAVIEFKLFYESISDKRVNAIIKDLHRLSDIISREKCMNVYFVCFQRLLKGSARTVGTNIAKIRNEFTAQKGIVNCCNAVWGSEEYDTAIPRLIAKPFFNF